MAYATEVLGLPFGVAGSLGGAYKAITAAGSTITDATPLTASMSVVAGADGNTGVILQGQVGDEVWVFNNSASTLKVYPPRAAAAIAVPATGLGTGGAAFSHLTYKTVIYKCMTSTQWVPQVTA